MVVTSAIGRVLRPRSAGRSYERASTSRRRAPIVIEDQRDFQQTYYNRHYPKRVAAVRDVNATFMAASASSGGSRSERRRDYDESIVLTVALLGLFRLLKRRLARSRDG